MNTPTSLQPYNTFGVDVHCQTYLPIRDVDTLRKHISSLGPSFVLGGGSNMLLTQDVPIPVLHMQIKGTEITHEDDQYTVVRFGAGEVWHTSVLWAIDNDLGGIENLSLIPGTMGAAPIQNIGAYGVELKDVFHSLEALHIESGEVRICNLGDCEFGYRSSVFKKQAKGKYIITAVSLRLTNSNHSLSLGYGAIQEKLQEKSITQPSVKDVSDIIIEIRQSKLPDPAVLGNSGSFFKNPIVSPQELEAIQADFPEVRSFSFGDRYKIPAAWLIEQCGWKGKRLGECGVSEQHALVLVNYGNATGKEILVLSQSIQESVHHKFGIQLTPEVNIF